MRLYRIILPVGDIESAQVFYSSLFQMQGMRVSPGRHYFNLGGTILACYDPKADGDDDNPSWKHHFNQYMYIGVDDLEGAFETIKKLNPKKVGDIKVMPWGERLFYANDPWGNPICLVDNTTLFIGE